MPEKTRYTIRDIAKEAGVSIATVSRCLNKSGYIDTETEQRIEAVVQKLGYKPSAAAQSLKTGKSRQLMLVVPDICNPFYSTMAKTVQGIARSRGYTLTLYNTNESSAEEIDSIQTAAEIHAAGIILCSINVSDEVIKALQGISFPAVVANSYENCPFDSVHGLMGEGTYIAAKHLLELGHSRIAFAGGARDSVTGARRKFGYTRALQEYGISVNGDYCFEMGFSEDSGYKAGKYFSALKPRPTAICCANDLIALGVLSALNESNISVPEEISLTGMDNIIFTNTSRPRLTTVSNDSEEFGRHVSELLFDRMEGRYDGPPRERLVSRKLIVRDSTRKPEG